MNTRTTLALLMMLALGIAGCGKRAPSSQPTMADRVAPTPPPSIAEIEKREAELYNDAPTADSEWCPRACVLVSEICGLSARICDLAKAQSDDATLAGQCSDGGARCERAKKHVATRCTCPADP